MNETAVYKRIFKMRNAATKHEDNFVQAKQKLKILEQEYNNATDENLKAFKSQQINALRNFFNTELTKFTNAKRELGCLHQRAHIHEAKVAELAQSTH